MRKHVVYIDSGLRVCLRLECSVNENWDRISFYRFIWTHCLSLQTL